jgi:hypothetical protein
VATLPILIGVTLSFVATLSIALVVPLWICGNTIDFA